MGGGTVRRHRTEDAREQARGHYAGTVQALYGEFGDQASARHGQHNHCADSLGGECARRVGAGGGGIERAEA